MMARTILQHFPPHRIYVEPFGGAASVLLQKPRAYCEVYNDVFDDVVNVFRVLRDPALAQRLRELCELTPFSRTEFAAQVDRSDPVEWARGVIFRSFAGFGSASAREDYRTGFRANSNRAGTTPAHDWANWPSHIVDYVARLRGVVIENRPAMDVMAQHDRGDCLHYLDPPYLMVTRSKSSQSGVYAHEMTFEQHKELLEFARTMQGQVIISGYRSDLYDEILKGWHRVDFGAIADGARKRTESLWMNYRLPNTLFN